MQPTHRAVIACLLATSASAQPGSVSPGLNEPGSGLVTEKMREMKLVLQPAGEQVTVRLAFRGHYDCPPRRSEEVRRTIARRWDEAMAASLSDMKALAAKTFRGRDQIRLLTARWKDLLNVTLLRDGKAFITRIEPTE